jgi:hypothetical protein
MSVERKPTTHPDQDDHALAAERVQEEIIRKMTPARRLEVARGLYKTALKLKAAGLRHLNPDWPEEQILAKVRRVFLTGYAGS